MSSDLKISVSGKCEKCGHPIQKTYMSNGKSKTLTTDVEPATPNLILECVSDATELKAGDIVGRSRREDLVAARHLYLWTLRTHLNLSWLSIGKPLGYDHTSVISAVGNVNRWLAILRPKFDATWFSQEPGEPLMIHKENFTDGIKWLYTMFLQSKRMKK